MIDAEASQPGDGLSLHQILQTDGTLSAVFTEHIRCKHTKQPWVFSSFFKKETAIWALSVTWYLLL